MAATNSIPKDVPLLKISTSKSNSPITFKTRINGYNKDYTIESTISQKLKDNAFEIFPNPAKETIIVSSINGQEIKEIFLYDMSGKLMLQKNVNANKKEINISNLPQAVYFVSIKTGSSTIIKRFIKQK